MTKAVCLVGLPGSGKTYLAARLATEQSCVIDDIRSLDELPENGVHDFVIITDPYFCLASCRELADKTLRCRYDDVEWRFFENSPEKCYRNVRFRADARKVCGLIRLLANDYVPDGEAIDIWQPQEQ